ncbi:ELWxxDGT repeat protein [Bacterioplanoides sp.]|uniref:ELWxxDGT repeat protein n=1 Tax=Bacterioplanoides sp. TaxID=2066072 RepID=UPI003B5AA918
MSTKIKLMAVAVAAMMATACGGSGSSGDNNTGTGNNNNGGGSTTTPPTAAKPQLLFSATTDINSGAELWITDGTTEGTTAVKDINASGDSSPIEFTKVGDQWFFSADDGVNGRELWVTDGTDAGTRLLKDINPNGDGYPALLASVNGKLMFRAIDPVHGSEIWVSDGTEAGTHVVKDIYPGSGGSGPQELTAFNNKLYFSALDNETLGSELWESDGTEAGTKITKRFSSGKVPLVNKYEGSIPSQLAVSNGQLFLTAKNNTRTNRSDPSNLEPHIVLQNGTAIGGGDLRSGFHGSMPADYLQVDFASGRATAFTANAGSGNEIWVHKNGSASKLTNFDDAGARPTFLVAAGNKLFFAATTATAGNELMMSEGVAGDETVVKDINAGVAGSRIRNITALGNKVIFVARIQGDEDSLWVSDGTDAGTQKILTLTDGNSMQQFMRLGNKILFSANNGSVGQELWITDGTSEGTMLLKDIRTGSDSSTPTFTNNQANQPPA